MSCVYGGHTYRECDVGKVGWSPGPVLPGVLPHTPNKTRVHSVFCGDENPVLRGNIRKTMVRATSITYVTHARRLVEMHSTFRPVADCLHGGSVISGSGSTSSTAVGHLAPPAAPSPLVNFPGRTSWFLSSYPSPQPLCLSICLFPPFPSPLLLFLFFAPPPLSLCVCVCGSLSLPLAFSVVKASLQLDILVHQL